MVGEPDEWALFSVGHRVRYVRDHAVRASSIGGGERFDLQLNAVLQLVSEAIHEWYEKVCIVLVFGAGGAVEARHEVACHLAFTTGDGDPRRVGDMSTEMRSVKPDPAHALRRHCGSVAERDVCAVGVCVRQNHNCGWAQTNRSAFCTQPAQEETGGVIWVAYLRTEV